jgi:hypothetical protein
MDLLIWSVPKMPHAGEHHCETGSIRGGDHLGIAY